MYIITILPQQPQVYERELLRRERGTWNKDTIDEMKMCTLYRYYYIIHQYNYIEGLHVL